MIECRSMECLKNKIPVGTSVVGIFEKSDYDALAAQSDDLLFMQERYDFITLIILEEEQLWDTYMQEFLLKYPFRKIQICLSCGGWQTIKFAKLFSTRCYNIPIVFCPKQGGLLHMFANYSFRYVSGKGMEYLGYRILSEQDDVIYPFFSSSRLDQKELFLQFVWLFFSFIKMVDENLTDGHMREGHATVERLPGQYNMGFGEIQQELKECYRLLSALNQQEQLVDDGYDVRMRLEQKMFALCQGRLPLRHFAFVSFLQFLWKKYGFPMEKLVLLFLPECMQSRMCSTTSSENIVIAVTRKTKEQWLQMIYGCQYHHKRMSLHSMYVSSSDIASILEENLWKTECSEEEYALIRRCLDLMK